MTQCIAHFHQTERKNTKVHLEKGWNSKQIITEGEAANPLETTLHAFRNQEKTKQRSTLVALLPTANSTWYL